MPGRCDAAAGRTDGARAGKPRAVLFDLWGTLILSDEFDPMKGNAAVLDAAEGHDGLSVDQLQELGGRIVTEVEPRELASHLEFTQQSLLRMLADSFGLRFRVSLVELEWIFWRAALRIRTTDGIRAALDGLASRGIATCVVSNSSFLASTIERELRGQGLLDRFSFVVSSADYGVRKPDPVIFEVALRRLGVSAAEAWFAGDNIQFDIEGAWSAGLLPIAYNPNEAVPAHVTDHRRISHWNELLGLVDSA
jgi:putative hydrolase of the HAD superfamily